MKNISIILLMVISLGLFSFSGNKEKPTESSRSLFYNPSVCLVHPIGGDSYYRPICIQPTPDGPCWIMVTCYPDPGIVVN